MIDDILKKINKKYLYIAGGVFLFIIILIGLGSCSSDNTSTVNIGFSKNSWAKIEKVMVDATKDYFSAFPHYKPDDGETKEIKVSTLVTKGYMYDLSEYVKDNVKCTGKVSVSNNDDTYTYTPSLDCGSAYSAVSLNEYVINSYSDQNKLFTLGSVESHYSSTRDFDGLYTDANNTEYYFRGTVDDNYIKIGDHRWRIMKIDSNGYIYAFINEYSTSEYWDSTYNSEFSTNEGQNDFNISELRQALDKAYNSEQYIPSSIKGKLVKTKWCIGKRKQSDTTNDGSIECSKLSDETYVGSIAAYEYLRASLDNNCLSSFSKECTNYNYLYSSIYWTLTGDAEASNKAFYVADGVGLLSKKTNNSTNLKYVIVLNKTTIKTGGLGTYDKPYTIK